MSLATCYLKVTFQVIPSYVWEGCDVDDGSKGTLYALSLEFCATFVNAIDILGFPIEATRGSLGEKSTHITSGTLGQDKMSWPHRPTQMCFNPGGYPYVLHFIKIAFPPLCAQCIMVANHCHIIPCIISMVTHPSNMHKI